MAVSYSNKLIGLCGNCNGRMKDDYRTRSGLDVSTYAADEQGVLIGDSFLVEDGYPNLDQ